MGRNIRGIALTLGAALSLSGNAVGQQSAPQASALRQELQRLGKVAEELDDSLPSLQCQEKAVSEQIVKGKVKKQVEFTATMSARRIDTGALSESVTVTTLNGKPHSGELPAMPFYTAGGFDRAMVYFATERQACYRYTLSPGRIDFETSPEVASHSECKNDGLHGFALLNADGDVTHLERRVSDEVSRNLHFVPFAAIDFAPVELGGKVFQLTQHIVSVATNGDSVGRFEASYSACQLFSVTVTIDPVTGLAPDMPPVPR